MSQSVKPPFTASGEIQDGDSFSYFLAAIDSMLLEHVLMYSNVIASEILARRALTAAADTTPNVADLFDKDLAGALFYDAYDAVFSGLVDLLEVESLGLMVPMQTIAPTIDTAVKYGVEVWRQAISDRLNDLLFNGSKPMKEGEWIEEPIRPGDIRGAITVASGGSVSSAVGIQPGFTAGKIVTDALAANGIPTDGWLWSYAVGAKRRGFDGHKQLSGLVFQQPDDPELLILPQDEWLNRTHYAINDHYGCSCTAVPWVGPNWGPSRVVQVDTA